MEELLGNCLDQMSRDIKRVGQGSFTLTSGALEDRMIRWDDFSKALSAAAGDRQIDVKYERIWDDWDVRYAPFGSQPWK